MASLDAVAVTGAAGQVDLVIEPDGLLGTGDHTGIAAGAQVQVDRVAGRPCHIERTQPALEALEPAGDHRVTPALAATGFARAVGPDRHLQRIGQQVGGALGGVQRAQDQQTPLAPVADGGHRLGFGQAGRGQQCSHFGGGLRTFGAPARTLADVDKSDRRHRPLGLGGQFGKEFLFLGAGHDHRVLALCGTLEDARLAAAQGAVFLQVLTEGLAQAACLQGQGLVAVANQGRHGWVDLQKPKNRATVPQVACHRPMPG